MKRSIILLFLLFGFMVSSASADMIVIPADVTDIQEEAFYNDNNVTEVTLPEHLLSIGPRAFLNTSLTHIFLPSSIESIADDSFDPDVKYYVEDGSYAHHWVMRHSDNWIRVGKILDGVESFVSVYADEEEDEENEDTISYLRFIPNQSGYYFFSFDGWDLIDSVYAIELYDAQMNLLSSPNYNELYGNDFYFDIPFQANREYILGLWSDKTASGHILAERRSLLYAETDSDPYVMHWDEKFTMEVDAAAIVGDLNYEWYQEKWVNGEIVYERIEGVNSPICVIKGPFTTSSYYRCIVTDCYGYSEKVDFEALLDY